MDHLLIQQIQFTILIILPNTVNHTADMAAIEDGQMCLSALIQTHGVQLELLFVWDSQLLDLVLVCLLLVQPSMLPLLKPQESTHKT